MNTSKPSAKMLIPSVLSFSDETRSAATPIVEVEGVVAKVEWVNPTGSIKDRIAQYILNAAEHDGLLRPGMRIIEASSDNTGIALAYHGKRLGYGVTIVMPEHMSQERIDIIRALGAELILCSEEGGFAEAAKIRDAMAAEDLNLFNPDQFSNYLNVECHHMTTGRELIAQMDKKVGAFVAGVGTGGTLMGIGQALRQRWPDVYIAAVEPAESAVMAGGEGCSHSIFGIGDGFIPCIASDGKGGVSETVDEVIQVSSAEALNAAKWLHDEHHLGVGTSSGANFVAAKILQERFPVVATVFADGSLKYLSCGLRVCVPGECRFPDRCSNSILPSLVRSFR